MGCQQFDKLTAGIASAVVGRGKRGERCRCRHERQEQDKAQNGFFHIGKSQVDQIHWEVSVHQIEAVKDRCDETAAYAKRRPVGKIWRGLMIRVNDQQENNEHVQCGEARDPKKILKNTTEHFVPLPRRKPIFTMGNIFEGESIHGQKSDSVTESDKKQRKTDLNHDGP